jgi:hypothetical protein
MKKAILALFSFLTLIISMPANAQNNKFFAANANTWSLSEQMPYGYLLVGSAPTGMIVWAQADSLGNIIKEKTYPGYFLTDAKYLPGKGLIVAGNALRASSDSAFLMQLDTAGNVLWVKSYTFPSYTQSFHIKVSVPAYSSNYWLMGTGFINNDKTPAFFIKTDITGKPILSEQLLGDTFGGISNNTPGAMVEGNDMSCYFALGTGFFEGSGATLFKTDSLFHFKKIIGTESSPPNSNGMIFYNNYLYVLWSKPYNSSNPGVQPTINLSEIDTSGTLLKSLVLSETFSGGGGGWGNSICHTADGGFIFAGITTRNRLASQEGLVVKIDSAWNIQWSKEYGFFNTSFDAGKINYIRPTRDGGYITAGTRLIKIDSIGQTGCNDSVLIYNSYTTSPVGLTLYTDTLILNYSAGTVTPNTTTDTNHFYCYGIITGLEQAIPINEEPSAFPNPNNGIFTIYVPVNSSQSSITIYNALGERVYASLLAADKTEINLNDKPVGIYLYRVTDNNGKLTGAGKFVIK